MGTWVEKAHLYMHLFGVELDRSREVQLLLSRREGRSRKRKEERRKEKVDHRSLSKNESIEDQREAV